MEKYVISVGGGIASTLLLPMKVLQFTERSQIDMLNARLPNEHSDLFKLIKSVENLLGIPIRFIGSGKEPFDIFDEVKFLGNTRVDPCSRILKRETIARYMEQVYDKNNTTICVGITAHETAKIDRRISIAEHWESKGWKVIFPLAQDETLTKEKQIEICQTLIGFVPKLYELDFSHNNCGGFCVKAGLKQWAKALYYFPEEYKRWELREKQWREKNGNYTILRTSKTVRGITEHIPITLETFRLRMKKIWKENPNIKNKFKLLKETSSCVFCESL